MRYKSKYIVASFKAEENGIKNTTMKFMSFELTFDAELSIIPSQEDLRSCQKQDREMGYHQPNTLNGSSNVALDRYMLMTPNAPFSIPCPV